MFHTCCNTSEDFVRFNLKKKWQIERFAVNAVSLKKRRQQQTLQRISRFTWGEQLDCMSTRPTCAERQDTHEEAFLHCSSAKQKSSNLSVWDFPLWLQLHSLISHKKQCQSIFVTFLWFIALREQEKKLPWSWDFTRNKRFKGNLLLCHV